MRRSPRLIWYNRYCYTIKSSAMVYISRLYFEMMMDKKIQPLKRILKEQAERNKDE